MPSVAQTRTVACPTCGTAVAWLPESRYRPFCSQRCKLIDLGAWAAEDYSVAAAEDSPQADDLHARH